MEPSAMEVISSRLASLEGLYFPRSFLEGASPPDSSRRKSALLDLLSRDAPIFLERYGAELTENELGAFEAMEGDYEVGWHLRRLRKARVPPTAEEERGRAAAVKNRRRAYMEELVRGGDYFSEDAMREREPYLHHEYVGRFQDPAGRAMPRPGERWSETLMRRAEEAMITGKIRGEQQRLGVDRREWVGGGGEEMEEEEEEEDDAEEEEEEEVEEGGAEEEEESEDGQAEQIKEEESRKMEGNRESDDHSGGEPSAGYGEGRVSAAELQDQLDQFTSIMQMKFLAGEDTAHVDYSKIDDNERLDDYWLKESIHDAEERYFDED